MHPKGFTLTELMIAMALSLVLVLMLITTFSTLGRSSRQIQTLAELQQNAQLVSGLFQNELVNIGFWGGLASPDLAAYQLLPTSPANDCIAPSIDSGSFPTLGQSFITLYARKVSASSELNCVSAAVKGSEILQLKRLVGQVFDSTSLKANRFFMETDWDHSRFVDVASTGKKQGLTYYPYQHVVFYIQNQSVDGIQIPVLMRKRLTRNESGNASMSTESVIDGIERIHFEFSFDSNLDGEVNYQLPTSQMTDAHWQQKYGRIVSIKYHVLLRARQPDPNYINNNHYEMGQEEFKATGDHFRRLLISSLVTLPNATL